MTIDYEKSFKKLVEQIKLETEWAKKDGCIGNDIYKYRPTKGNTKGMNNFEFDTSVNVYSRMWYDKGIYQEARSLLSLAEKLEKGEFDFEG